MLKEKRMDVNFRRRLQRKLYYGDLADLDTPSLPLTELAVDYFRDSVPEKLGHVDLYTASNVIKRNRVSPCSMVLSMLYAKRLRQQKQRSKEYLQTMSSSDVFFISMMMASKYLYDEGVEEEVFNDEWADNSDQDVEDVNQMEIDFLQAMDWKLFVRPHEFEETLSAIERRLALQEGLKRGWFTYSEMDILMDMDLMRAMWWHVGAECSKLVTAISAAYLTSLLSMVGSTALALHISGPLSSGTIALFTLQASPFGYSISAGLPSLSSVSFSTSFGLGMFPSSVRYKDTTEKNESELEMAASVLDRELGLENGNGDAVDDGRKLGFFIDALGSRNDASKGHDRNESGDDGGGGGGGDGGLGSGRYADGCGGKRGDGDGHSTRSTNPSWWSLWFLDSLLSQLWAVASIRSKLTHSGGESIEDKFSRWSCSSKDSDRSCQSCGNADDDSSDRQRPCFRRRQREMKHHHQHCVTNLGTRNPQTNSRTTVHPCGLDSETSGAAHGLCQSGQVMNEDQVCSSCGANQDRPTHPWCNWPCRSAFSPSRPICDLCSSLSLNQPNCEPPTDNHIRANPTSLASSCSKNPCPCGSGVGMMSVNLQRNQNREPHFSHAVAALDPPEELMKRPAILPQLESSYELLRVPLGFFTSISQVLQAA